MVSLIVIFLVADYVSVYLDQEIDYLIVKSKVKRSNLHIVT